MTGVGGRGRGRGMEAPNAGVQDKDGKVAVIGVVVVVVGVVVVTRYEHTSLFFGP